MTVLLSLSVLPWAIGAYVLLVLGAVVVCRAARRGDELLAAARAEGVPEPPRSPQTLVAQAVRALGADGAALFGWDVREDRLCVLATAGHGGAVTDAARRLAQQAFTTGRLSVRPPALVPAPSDGELPATGLAVPAARAELRVGALCVTRGAARPFTARDRAALLRLGEVATEVLAGPARSATVAHRSFSA
jgi:hypothetical protein